MKSSEDYLKELFEEPFNLEEGSIEYDFLKVLKKAQLEFAISVLEDLIEKFYELNNSYSLIHTSNKIQELKTYLNEKS